jgi:hypothetical protein
MDVEDGRQHRMTGTIEAILICVRERGLNALKEPTNVERLSRCDAAARAQIDARLMTKFKGNSK